MKLLFGIVLMSLSAGAVSASNSYIYADMTAVSAQINLEIERGDAQDSREESGVDRHNVRYEEEMKMEVLKLSCRINLTAYEIVIPSNFIGIKEVPESLIRARIYGISSKLADIEGVNGTIKFGEFEDTTKVVIDRRGEDDGFSCVSFLDGNDDLIRVCKSGGEPEPWWIYDEHDYFGACTINKD